MAIQDRDQLKSFFTTGAVPTQSQFADLIDSAVNLADDGLQVDGAGRLAIGATAPSAKLTVEGGFDNPLSGTITVGAAAGSPPSAQASGAGTKFSSQLSVGSPVKIGGVAFNVSAITDDTHMTVTGPAATPVTNAAGFVMGPLLAVTDANGAARVVVDRAGNVGIGTAAPGSQLQVQGTVIATKFQGDGASITNLAAGNIASGIIDPNRMPAIDAGNITSGVLNAARLPAIDAATLTGTLDSARLPPGLRLKDGLVINGHEDTPNGIKSSIVLGNDAPGGSKWNFTVGATGTNTPAKALRIENHHGAELTISDLGIVEVYKLDVISELNVRSGKISASNFNLSGNSVFLGNFAGGPRSTGEENTFVGQGAGGRNTTGATNTFVGAQNGQSNDAGVNNSFFGQNTGPNNTTGSSNVFVGVNAGLNNLSGQHNTFVGNDAGITNATGSKNVAIGDGAGVGAGDLVNAVAIGADAVVSQSNSMVLGSTDGIGNGSVDTNVGIGTSSPLRPLEVKSNWMGGIEATAYGRDIPRVTGRKANGTLAAPTHVAANDVLAEFGGRGRAATDYTASARGSMSIVAVEDWTDQAQGARIDFSTTPKGNTQPQTALTINSDGSVKAAGTITSAQKVIATALQGDGASITNLKADNIASGTIDPNRMPTIDAGKITSGVLNAARLPAIDAATLTGTIDPNRISTIDAGKITSGILNAARLPAIDAATLTGTLDSARLPSGLVLKDGLLVKGHESTPGGTKGSIALANEAAGGGTWSFTAGATGTNTPAGALRISNLSGAGLAISNTGKVEVQSLDVTAGDLNVKSGKLSGNGAGLTALNAAAVDTGVLKAEHGGTGLAAPGAAGNILQSNGTTWQSATPASLPQPKDAILNSTAPQPNSNFNISGTGKAVAFDASQEFRIGGTHVLSTGPVGSIFLGNVGGTQSTGGENTFVGQDVGSNNTTGGMNTFVGSQTGLNNIAGICNSFFGRHAGPKNTAGRFNTLVGVNAGLSNSSGDANTFVGMNTATANTTGHYNVAIGYGADMVAGDLVNAVAIGAFAWVSQSNSIVLGSIAGIGAATADTSVGIGTTSPLRPLEVKSNDKGGIEATGYGAIVPRFNGRKANGTPAAPTHVAANDVLAEFGGRGRAASDYSDVARASMTIVAVEDWTDQAQGARIHFSTTPQGTKQPHPALTILSDGNVNVSGTITAAQKQFRIDHPLDPENLYLNHVSVESSEMINMYSGNVTTNAEAEAEVLLPEWFCALNTDFRYQLTVIGKFAQAIISKKVANNRFSIRTSLPEVEVSWLLTGIRKDSYAVANPVRVEERKSVRTGPVAPRFVGVAE